MDARGSGPPLEGRRTRLRTLVPADYDYLYVLFTRPGQENPDPSRLAAKFVGERFALYRILPPAQEAPAIQESPSAGAGPQVVRVGPAIRQGAATPTRQRRVN